MRGTGTVARFATVLLGASLCVACAAPQFPFTAPSAGPSSAEGSGPAAPTQLPLPDGVMLPIGVTLVGPAPVHVRRGAYVEWKATYRLGSSSEQDVLDAVERSLTALGWSVQRGRHDDFATRCSQDRCELLTARTTTAETGATLPATVLVMYASRPA